MTRHQVVPAWARDFNNKPRHCFINTSGKRIKQGYPNDPCTEDHDPKLAGNTEWLRFIRAFGPIANGDTGLQHDNPFVSGDDSRYFLLNEVDGHPTSDGRITYSETYLRRKQRGEWGVTPVFRVFLDNEAGWARIECYDEGYVGSCELALAAVEQQYKKEAT